MKAFLFIVVLTVTYGLSAFGQLAEMDRSIMGEFFFNGAKNSGLKFSIKPDGTFRHDKWGVGTIISQDNNQYAITFPHHDDPSTGNPIKCQVHINPVDQGRTINIITADGQTDTCKNIFTGNVARSMTGPFESSPFAQHPMGPYGPQLYANPYGLPGYGNLPNPPVEIVPSIPSKPRPSGEEKLRYNPNRREISDTTGTAI